MAVVLFLILAPIYVLFASFLYFNQANFFYYPDKQDFDDCQSFNDYQKVRTGGTRMFYKEKSTDDVIVYYHGNTGSACDRTHIKRILKDSEKSIVFVEYAGYANDGRVLSKSLIFQDVRNVNVFINAKGFENIIVVGESIGSGSASYHSSIGSVNKIILVAPFSKIEEIARHRYPIFPISVMIKENYNNVEILDGYNGEILVIFGTEDMVIPTKFSEKLYETLNVKDKKSLSIFGANHNNIFNQVETIEGIEKFIKD